MTIYFIQAGTSGAIKIGYTSGPATARLSTLQTGCPDELLLRAAHHGTVENEQALHERFAACRIRGEWFRCTPELAAYIDGVNVAVPLQHDANEAVKRAPNYSPDEFVSAVAGHTIGLRTAARCLTFIAAGGDVWECEELIEEILAIRLIPDWISMKAAVSAMDRAHAWDALGKAREDLARLQASAALEAKCVDDGPVH